MITEVLKHMNKDKKTEVITIRLSKALKEYLEASAMANQWSVAQVAATIIEERATNPYPNAILISLEKLEKLIAEIKEKDPNRKAIHLEISLQQPQNTNEEIYEKVLDISTLKNGFRDENSNFDSIPELTCEEVYELEGMEQEARDRMELFLQYQEIWNEIMLNAEKKCQNCHKYTECPQASKKKVCSEWFINQQEWEKYFINKHQ